MELIAIAAVIVLSVGLAVAATKLVMDVLLSAMRPRPRADRPAGRESVRAIRLAPKAILPVPKARRRSA